MVLAYQIRYGEWKQEGNDPNASVRLAVCAGILVGTIMISLLWPDGRAVLQRLLWNAPETDLEQATAALAGAVSSGKGWYYGFTAFVARILASA